MVPPARVAPVLWASGLLGGFIALLSAVGWQDCVEPAQVLAGVVVYPRPTSYLAYQTRIWTGSHQGCALLLAAGMDERTVSVLVSGLLGALSFTAISLTTWVIGRNAWLALACPVLIHLTRAAAFGTVYPVFLMGSPQTYGILGLSYVALTLAVLGANRRRLGGFLLGVAPAVHPTLAAGLWLIVAAAAIPELRAVVRDGWKPFAAGASFAAVSLAVHLAFFYQVPTSDPAVAAETLDAFVRGWDSHRQPVDPAAPEVLLNAAALALVALAPSGTDRFLMRGLGAAGVLGLASIPLTWMDPAHLPGILVTLMPARFLNLCVLLFVPLVLGLLARHRDRRWGAAGLAIAFGGIWAAAYGRVFGVWTLLACAALALTAFLRPTPAGMSLRGCGLIATVLLSLFTLAQGVRISVLSTRWGGEGPVIRDRTNDPLLARVAAGKGLLLTGSNLHLIQLKARRPILLNGMALNMLPYVPQAGPEMRDVLRRIYGVDMLHPPAEVRGAQGLPAEFGRALWESRTPEEWRDVLQPYGVTEILTYADWSLSLPRAARNDQYALWTVPP